MTEEAVAVTAADREALAEASRIFGRAMVDGLGPDKANELAAAVIARHRHEAIEAAAKVAEAEIVETFEDSPEADTVCNAIVREIATAIRNLAPGRE